jgi:hypothetical protein
MSTLLHVLRGTSPERNWAVAVNDLAAMDSFDQTRVWLALYKECGSSVSLSLSMVSQCDFLMQQALREVQERRSFVLADIGESGKTQDTADSPESSDHDSQPPGENPSLEELRLKYNITGTPSTLNTVLAPKNADEQTTGFNKLLELVRQSTAQQHQNESPLNATRRLIAEFGTDFLYSILDRDFQGAIARRRTIRMQGLKDRESLDTTDDQSRMVKARIELDFKDMEMKTSDVDMVFLGLLKHHRLDELAYCAPDRFQEILNSFFEEQMNPPPRMNSINPEERQVRPFSGKVMVRPVPQLPVVPPDISAEPSPVSSRASSVAAADNDDDNASEVFQSQQHL